MSTDWETCYRTGETPWDKGAAAPPLLEWLARPGHCLEGEVLVPGCGYGHDVRAIASTAHVTTVSGLDLSEAAVERARLFPPAGGESYLVGDLFALPTRFRARFDWVFEHTCFCAIDPARRKDYVRAVATALKPGGRLLAIFYLDPWSGERTLPPGGGPPFATSVDELDTLFAERFRTLEEYVPGQAFPGRQERELVRLLRREK